MRILVVQNSRTAPIGIVGEALVDNGATLVTVKANEGEVIPAMDGFDGLVVLGGPQDAWDDGHGPHFPAVMETIRNFTEADRPVMGICLGAQLAARAYGAPVYRHETPELGVCPVTLNGEAATDPVLGGLGPDLKLVQWHYDTFEFPEGAVPLAFSDICGRQAFRLGRATYGFQFHPEATAEIVTGWASRFGEEKREKNRSLLDGLPGALDAHLPAAETFARTITRRWMDLAAP
ncbi:type 1 glutamine amidotransferase [Azospirillum doebereinerae]|uniref:Type 1 glutamine amidotransferase n=1 Tax=Azospirillum doebereinerae TaxID=92933 RepID=A0A433J588_9PROT|nr:type 1 glutamine amidotransferase [Azospirillum doebereinerae]MCG5243601.1 type 1 glutamine amidotransferase [Azospirillum doebereinerae]RUQ67606.1 type 1 glutamine amidotransferase [Azospirillum doebereinerae]